MNSEAGQYQFSPIQLKLFLILKITCFCVFIGHAWEHLRWDPPYRTLFWDQAWLQGIVEGISNRSWMDYATSPAVDNFIQNFTLSVGWFYVLCAIASLVINKKDKSTYRICKYILIAGSMGLVLLAFLYSKERFFEAGQFLEHAAQFTSPIFLLFILSFRLRKKLVFFLKIVIALTFICHGLYATGYYPTPGNWVDMVLLTFNLSEQGAIQLLHFIGILDVIFSILIFVPIYARAACLYLFFWGFVTAIARVWTNLYVDSSWLIAEQYLHEVIYRAPHFLLPLLLFIIKKTEKSAWIERLKRITIVTKKLTIRGLHPEN